MKKSLILFLITTVCTASIARQSKTAFANHRSLLQPTTIGKLVIPKSDCWIRVGETSALEIQAFDEHDQPIPVPALQYVINRPPDGALGGNRPELVSIDPVDRTVTGLFTGVTSIRAVDPNVTERGQVSSNELTIVVLPQKETPPKLSQILVAGYVKVDGAYFDRATEVSLISSSGEVERLVTGPDGYFHFGWGNHFGKVLTINLRGYFFQPQVIDGREYYIINGRLAPASPHGK